MNVQHLSNTFLKSQTIFVIHKPYDKFLKRQTCTELILPKQNTHDNFNFSDSKIIITDTSYAEIQKISELVYHTQEIFVYIKPEFIKYRFSVTAFTNHYTPQFILHNNFSLNNEGYDFYKYIYKDLVDDSQPYNMRVDMVRLFLNLINLLITFDSVNEHNMLAISNMFRFKDFNGEEAGKLLFNYVFGDKKDKINEKALLILIEHPEAETCIKFFKDYEFVLK